MANKKNSFTVDIGSETPLTFETGQMAKLANGSVNVCAGDTVVFASACASSKADPDIDFFPLRVDYQEKFSSAGRFLGGFLKKENRPTEKEVLTCRLIDRPIRPMFPEGYFNEVQLISYVLSYDGINQSQPLALCAASAALVISDIPLLKPIAGVQVGLIDDKFIINPTVEQAKISKLDLLLAGTEDAILMIEGHCDFLTDDQVIESIETGHEAIKKICHALAAWQKEVGKEKKIEVRKRDMDFAKELEDAYGARIKEALKIQTKTQRNEAMDAISTSAKEQFLPAEGEPRVSRVAFGAEFKQLKTKLMRSMILDDQKRIDGRKTDEIRQITVDMDPLPRTHGSALFTRGETQALAVCTLGSVGAGQRYESLDDGDCMKNFYLHYTFPPFSVGEVGRVGGASRREIGHGKLAENSITKILPDQESFPYTIRLESNILESNGSSSMASVCGGCLALMQAGVPIKQPISGIAMGLILEGDRHAILSDILGDEDALGDMDFKVTGNAEGITCFQLDIKVEGITHEIMKAALAQAKAGRAHILGKMTDVMSKPKDDLSKYAPRIESIKIDPAKIGTVIGPGGKMIKKIQEDYEVEINISDEGVVAVCCTDKDNMEKALQTIKYLVAEAEVGKTYEGKVVSRVNFGVFVEIFPGKEGLVHISELEHRRVDDIEKVDYTKEGSPMTVKVLGVDEKTKKIKLSRKALLPKEESTEK